MLSRPTFPLKITLDRGQKYKTPGSFGMNMIVAMGAMICGTSLHALSNVYWPDLTKLWKKCVRKNSEYGYDGQQGKQ